jgi:hypothetical protein
MIIITILVLLISPTSALWGGDIFELSEKTKDRIEQGINCLKALDIDREDVIAVFSKRAQDPNELWHRRLHFAQEIAKKGHKNCALEAYLSIAANSKDVGFGIFTAITLSKSRLLQEYRDIFGDFYHLASFNGRAKKSHRVLCACYLKQVNPNDYASHVALVFGSITQHICLTKEEKIDVMNVINVLHHFSNDPSLGEEEKIIAQKFLNTLTKNNVLNPQEISIQEYALAPNVKHQITQAVELLESLQDDIDDTAQEYLRTARNPNQKNHERLEAVETLIQLDFKSKAINGYNFIATNSQNADLRNFITERVVNLLAGARSPEGA